MNFTLKRIKEDISGIYGKWIDEDGDDFCVALEHSFGGLPAIPAGQYKCQRRVSPHFGYKLFVLLNVPEHDFIEIHKGNTQAQSQGCILLGTAFNGDFMANSKAAFDKFMGVQEGVNEWLLTVLDPGA